MATVKAATATVTRTRANAQKDARNRQAQARQAAIVLKHASDPTRLRVLLMLAGGERHVGSLCEELGQSQPAVSHHLALLRHGGVIEPRRQGKNNFYSLTEAGEQLAGIAQALLG
jgi:DNA-binding transcriptional ArsR family regulator